VLEPHASPEELAFEELVFEELALGICNFWSFTELE
jgi:hypothetical protein